jgi:sugar/nucleoside kinase (ribokinase family)
MRYLVIGHVCKDLIPGGWTFGGAVTYSARTAHMLGCQVQAITSAAPDCDVVAALPEIKILLIPGHQTTTFENVYTERGRRQTILAVAASLTPDQVAARFETDIVHLAPVAQEVDPAWCSHDHFPGALICATPQGWMRQWDSAGRVHPGEWAGAAEMIPQADVVIASIEDIAYNEALAQQWAAWARLLVITRGPEGCTLYRQGETVHVPTRPGQPVDTTGAGDVFAAAFAVRLRETGDALAAARFANCMAGYSIARYGLGGIPTAEEAQWCRAG